MDFSFVTDVNAQQAPTAGASSSGAGAGPGSSRPLIQIPSFREVQAAQQRGNAPDLFSSRGRQLPPSQPRWAGPGPPAPGHAAGVSSSNAAGSAWQGSGSSSGNSFSLGPGGPAHQTAPSGQQHPQLPQAQQRIQLQADPGPHLPLSAPRQPQPAINVLNAGTSSGSMGGGASGATYHQRPQQQQQFFQPAQPPAMGANQPLPPQPQQQPYPAPLPTNAIVVSQRQQGNPVLKHIRNVRWQFGDIVPDYLVGQAVAALFLSLRYHLLHPEYFMHRIKELQRAYRLVVLLVHVDVDDMVKPLGEITRHAVLNDVTVVCAWSPEECARWLETLKSYETKPANAIQERVEFDYVSRLSAAITSVRGVNRTDAVTLGQQFGSLAALLMASEEELSACPGIGPTKVKRLFEAFNEPFRKTLRTADLSSPGGSQQLRQQHNVGANPASEADRRSQQQPAGGHRAQLQLHTSGGAAAEGANAGPDATVLASYARRAPGAGGGGEASTGPSVSAGAAGGRMQVGVSSSPSPHLDVGVAAAPAAIAQEQQRGSIRDADLLLSQFELPGDEDDAESDFDEI